MELLLVVWCLTHALKFCVVEWMRVMGSHIASHDSNKMRPLTTVIRWRGTPPTKYTAGGIKMLRCKQRLGKGNMTTQLRQMRSLLDGGDGARVTPGGKEQRPTQSSSTIRADPSVDPEATSYRLACRTISRRMKMVEANKELLSSHCCGWQQVAWDYY